jgi:hypothetical protein
MRSSVPSDGRKRNISRREAVCATCRTVFLPLPLADVESVEARVASLKNIGGRRNET